MLDPKIQNVIEESALQLRNIFLASTLVQFFSLKENHIAYKQKFSDSLEENGRFYTTDELSF